MEINLERFEMHILHRALMDAAAIVNGETDGASVNTLFERTLEAAEAKEHVFLPDKTTGDVFHLYSAVLSATVSALAGWHFNPHTGTVTTGSGS